MFREVVFVDLEKDVLKPYIFKYISDFIASTNNCNFLKKIKIIEEVSDIFDKYKVNYKENYSKLFTIHDKIFFDRLIYVFSNFNKNLCLNKEIYIKFSKEFDLNFKNFFYPADLRTELEKISDDQQVILFFSEFMNLYKYINDIPELITLCGLFSKKSFYKLIVVIRLIHLFAKNINGNIKENRFFILCMISKAFECMYNKKFDIFMIPTYDVKCCISQHDLNYFLWEFNNFKRKDMKKRKRTHLDNNPKDLKYLNTALLIYLYQHTIFMKYFNVDIKYIKSFVAFVHNVIESKGCVGCFFNEYLNIIRIEQ